MAKGFKQRPPTPSTSGMSASAVTAPPPAVNKEAANLARWRASGKPKQWVAQHKAQWNHEEWLRLLEDLKRSEYWPMKVEEIGLALEALKRG